MLFAISRTSDPAGAWFTYKAPNTSFLDQDKIEATSDTFVIAGNTSTAEQIYVYNLSDLVNGVAKPAHVSKTAKKSNIYQAAVQQTASSTAYFVSSFPGNQLYLAKITGDAGGQQRRADRDGGDARPTSRPRRSRPCPVGTSAAGCSTAGSTTPCTRSSPRTASR